MNRAERRRRSELKCIRRLKKYWAKCGLDHIFDRQNHKIVYAPTLNDALKIEHETKGRLFGWLSAVKKVADTIIVTTGFIMKISIWMIKKNAKQKTDGT